MNEADLWFEHSAYCTQSEIENMRGVIRQVSRSYRATQMLTLENIRTEIDKLIKDWRSPNANDR